MKLRNQRIKSQLEPLKYYPNLEVIECEPDGISRQDLWIVWVKGKKGTLYQNGIYPVTINFPENYPMEPPSIQFQKQFLHIHVYEGGHICLPLLDSQNWKPKQSMQDILKRIHSLISQQINQYSPANCSLYEIYKTNKPKYDQLIIQQAKKYSQKAQKYFLTPSIHIEQLNEQ